MSTKFLTHPVDPLWEERREAAAKQGVHLPFADPALWETGNSKENPYEGDTSYVGRSRSTTGAQPTASDLAQGGYSRNYGQNICSLMDQRKLPGYEEPQEVDGAVLRRMRHKDPVKAENKGRGPAQFSTTTSAMTKPTGDLLRIDRLRASGKLEEFNPRVPKGQTLDAQPADDIAEALNLARTQMASTSGTNHTRFAETEFVYVPPTLEERKQPGDHLKSEWERAQAMKRESANPHPEGDVGEYRPRPETQAVINTSFREQVKEQIARKKLLQGQSTVCGSEELLLKQQSGPGSKFHARDSDAAFTVSTSGYDRIARGNQVLPPHGAAKELLPVQLETLRKKDPVEYQEYRMNHEGCDRHTSYHGFHDAASAPSRHGAFGALHPFYHIPQPGDRPACTRPHAY